jgi:hypothetical protein
MDTLANTPNISLLYTEKNVSRNNYPARGTPPDDLLATVVM